MSDFTELLKFLVDNGDAISGMVVGFIGTVIFVYALETDKIYTAGRVKDITRLCDEDHAALGAARVELEQVSVLLAKLQTEKDLLWQHNLQNTKNPR